MSLAKLSGLSPSMRHAVQLTLAWGQYYGLRPEVTSGYRSPARQAELYANRATNPYPVAAPGQSAHNWGLAWDSWVPAQQMPLWVAIRRAVGWQVPEGDAVHAAVPNWRQYVR